MKLKQRNKGALTPLPPPRIHADPPRRGPQVSAPAFDPIPDRYVIFTRTQKCLCCGSEHTWTELFCETLLRHSTTGKTLSNLRRTNELRYRLPITTRTSEPEIVHVCHACSPGQLHAALTALPPPDYARDLLAPIWASQERNRETERKREPRVGTLDDLSDLLTEQY